MCLIKIYTDRMIYIVCALWKSGFMMDRLDTEVWGSHSFIVIVFLRYVVLFR